MYLNTFSSIKYLNTFQKWSYFAFKYFLASI